VGCIAKFWSNWVNSLAQRIVWQVNWKLLLPDRPNQCIFLFTFLYIVAFFFQHHSSGRNRQFGGASSLQSIWMVGFSFFIHFIQQTKGSA